MKSWWVLCCSLATVVCIQVLFPCAPECRAPCTGHCQHCKTRWSIFCYSGRQILRFLYTSESSFAVRPLESFQPSEQISRRNGVWNARLRLISAADSATVGTGLRHALKRLATLHQGPYCTNCFRIMQTVMACRPSVVLSYYSSR